MFGRNADLLAEFVRRGVRFVIVGGVAVNFYVPEREFDDLDVLVDASEQNARLAIDAINSGGLKHYGDDAMGLSKTGVHWSLTRDGDYYADILTVHEDMEFDSILRAAKVAHVSHSGASIEVRIADIPTLIATKMARRSPKDVSDIELLERLMTC